MELSPRLILALAILGLAGGATEARADVISQWNFSTVNAGPINSPAPEVGAGTATVLGMNNSYTFSSGNKITGSGTFTFKTLYGTQSTAAADITATAGDPANLPNAWRVRGPSNNINGQGGFGNGWALQAPQYTQGVQFSSSTAGLNNISFHFDWFTTTQGVKNLQAQYTLNGMTWININSPLTAVSNGWLPTQTINFSGIAGASNDPNFGVRLVSVYDPTLAIPNYGSADGDQDGYYNNNSGNWRFTNVGFTGVSLSAVPEPSTLTLSLSLFAAGLGAVVVRRRRGM
jgi:hypothetical protein